MLCRIVLLHLTNSGECIILHPIMSLAVGTLTEIASGGIMSMSSAIGTTPDIILAKSTLIEAEGTVHLLVLLRHLGARHL